MMIATHVTDSRYTVLSRPGVCNSSIEDALAELARRIRSDYGSSVEQRPTEDEARGLETGSLVSRMVRLFQLQRKYRDGWHFSAIIAELCYHVQVPHFGNQPKISFVPAVTDVLAVMEETGCEQSVAVEALGGIN